MAARAHRSEVAGDSDRSPDYVSGCNHSGPAAVRRGSVLVKSPIQLSSVPRGNQPLRQDQSIGPAGTRIEVLEPAGHPSGGSHTASASESVSAANTRSGEALMTPTAVSVRPTAGAPVALVDHARAERPGLDQV